jgi:hypothetical protein
MLNKLKAKLLFNARKFGHVRFEEPVLVFESDDWGKMGGQPQGDYPESFGKRTDWSYDCLENTAELEALYRVLESFGSYFERIPAFTANVIVSNPDFKRIKEGNYAQLYLKRIDEDAPEVVEKWQDGIARNTFFPQYHGRLHYNRERYLGALQNDEATRYLFNQHINGGRENFKETTYALYSEYFNTESSAGVTNLEDWIAAGLTDFEQLFGFKSTSTIAPNYVIHPSDFSLLSKLGINFLQGGNKVLFTKKGKEDQRNFCQGYAANCGLTVLARNHKFEPCRGKKEWRAEFSIEAAKHWFKRGVPAVIDTHRMNYVTQFGKTSRKELRVFLEAMTKIKGLRILTTPELGEAITNQGRYTDSFSGEKKQLALKDIQLRKLIRQVIS